MQGHPNDADLDGWKEAAKIFYNARMANAAFQEANHTLFPSQPRFQGATSTFPTPTSTVSVPRGGTFASRPPLLTQPVLNPGVPIEIDMARRNQHIPGACRRCGRMGHWTCECPQTFDIWYMNTEEWEEFVQSIFHDVDTNNIEAREEEQREEVPTPAESSGFGHSDESAVHPRC